MTTRDDITAWLDGQREGRDTYAEAWLRYLLDALSDAATGLRRELGLPATGGAPGVARPGSAASSGSIPGGILIFVVGELGSTGAFIIERCVSLRCFTFSACFSSRLPRPLSPPR